MQLGIILVPLHCPVVVPFHLQLLLSHHYNSAFDNDSRIHITSLQERRVKHTAETLLLDYRNYEFGYPQVFETGETDKIRFDLPTAAPMG